MKLRLEGLIADIENTPKSDKCPFCSSLFINAATMPHLYSMLDWWECKHCKAVFIKHLEEQ